MVEGGILLPQLVQPIAQLLQVGLGVGLDCDLCAPQFANVTQPFLPYDARVGGVPIALLGPHQNQCLRYAFTTCHICPDYYTRVSPDPDSAARFYLFDIFANVCLTFGQLGGIYHEAFTMSRL